MIEQPLETTDVQQKIFKNRLKSRDIPVILFLIWSLWYALPMVGMHWRGFGVIKTLCTSGFPLVSIYNCEYYAQIALDK